MSTLNSGCFALFTENVYVVILVHFLKLFSLPCALFCTTKHHHSHMLYRPPSISYLFNHIICLLFQAFLFYQQHLSLYSAYIINSKMVGCAVTLDTSFAQFRNREYRMINKVTLLNSMYIIPSRTNVNKRLAVK